MDRVWAPWRANYVTGEKTAQDGRCIFCDKPAGADMRKELVLCRGARVFALMNLYPYNGGHIMVAPYEHVSCMTELPDDALLEIMTAAKKLVPVLREVMKPDGFNMGFNLGRAAGAGLERHMHFHIVPRWSGDSNFMAALADTRVISEHIETTYDRLREAIVRAEIEG